MKQKKGRRGQVEIASDEGLVILFITIAVLIIMFGVYLVLSGKLEGALEFLKNIFRLRGGG